MLDINAITTCSYCMMQPTTLIKRATTLDIEGKEAPSGIKLVHERKPGTSAVVPFASDGFCSSDFD